jgi:hypothetical protein
MPKRTNEFQQVVTYIYSQIVPRGGRVTESALLQESGDGAQREIDILIEYALVGHDLRIAVECRDRGRDQTVEWVDGLIGKYSRLKVNQIVAISASPFSAEAKRKAAEHNMDLITVNEALTRDWTKRVERWKMMTHSFTLMRVGGFGADGRQLFDSEITEDGKEATHRDELSEQMYALLYPYFMQHLSKGCAQKVDAKIAENWQFYVTDPRSRWVEFTVPVPKSGITRYGEDIGVEKLVFGVGVHFHVGSPGEHFALREHALSKVTIKTLGADKTLRMITDRQGNPLKIDFGNGLVLSIPTQSQ